MSFIEKMSILGIRSFSSDGSQNMKFNPPVTLIVGPNGSGKTTIIECLKYATTGELPAGSKTSGAFIYDPKLAHETEVKAKVQLQIKDIKGDTIVVTRNIQATQTKNKDKVCVKTLESIVKRKNRGSNEEQTVSGKCADIDKLVVESLGVSKAILENVLFCHQDDSNWPLAEGKVLKQRFDDIFSSTRYVKALDVIEKSRKAELQKAKTFKVEVQHLKKNFDHSEEENHKLQQVVRELSQCKENKEKVDQDLKPLQKQLDDYKKRQTEMITLDNCIEKLAEDKLRELISVQELREHLGEHEFDGSDRDLAEQSEKLSSRDYHLKKELDDCNQKRKNCELQHKQLAKSTEPLLVKQGRLQQEAVRAKEDAEKLRETAEKFSRGNSDPKEVLKQLELNLQSEEKDGQIELKELEGKVNNADGKLTDAREAKTKAEQTRKMKKESLETNESEIRKKKSQLEETAGAKDRLESISRRARAAEQQLVAADSQSPINDLRRNEESLKEEGSELKEKIAVLEPQLENAREHAEVRQKVDSLEEGLNTHRKEAERLRRKNRDTLNEIIKDGRSAKGGLQKQLEKVMEGMQKEQEKMQKQIAADKGSLNSLEAGSKYVDEDIASAESKRKNLELKIKEVLDGETDVQSALEEVQEKKRRVEDKIAEIQGNVHAFKRFKDKLLSSCKENEVGDCPLCHRGFDSRADVDDLVAELDQNVRRFPRDLQNKERDLEELRNKETKLIQLQPEEDNLKDLVDVKLVELRKKSKSLLSDVAKLKKSLSSQEEFLALKLDDIKMAQEVIPDVVLIDKEDEQVEKMAGELEDLKRKLGVDAKMTSEAELQTKMKNLRRMQEDKQTELEEIREKIKNHTERLQTIRDNANKFKEEELKIRSDIAEMSKLQADVAELQKVNAELDREVSELRDGMMQHNVRVEDAEQMLTECKAEYRLKEQELQKMLTRLGDDVKKLREQMKVVQSYKEGGQVEKLENLERKLQETTVEMEMKKREEEKAAAQCEKLREEQSRLVLRARELSDCKKLRESQTKADELELRLTEMKDKRGNLNVMQIERMLPQLRVKEEKLEKQRSVLSQEITILDTRKTEHQKQLRSALLRNAESQYREKLYDLRVSETASDDLRKYYAALDTAIMRYHTTKMNDLNKIIDELWRNTYKHNDIDTVKVEFDKESSAETAGNKTRRTFNYRVAMIKCGVQMDMRGRCSAGQKVLTSLIIRLALAETFGINCGILALDEPTTNLDRENIASLAQSLTDIIASRRNQNNFQLVIITHDEDFLKLMGDRDLVDDYYRLARTMEGTSRVARMKYGQQPRSADGFARR